MSKYLGKVSDKRNRTAYLTDNSFPNIEEVEHSEVNNKKFKLYWLATYTENSHLYEVFDEFTPIKPRALTSKKLVIKGYIKNELGEYYFSPNWGFLRTEESKQKLSYKTVQNTKSAVVGGINAVWTVIAVALAFFFVFPQCFT